MKQTYTFASASVSLILIVCQWPQSLSEAVVLLLVAPTSSTFSHSHTTLLLVHSVSPISLYSTHRLEMPPIASCRFAAPWPHLLERKSDHCCFFFFSLLGEFWFCGFCLFWCSCKWVLKKFEAFAALVLESLVCVGSSSSYFFLVYLFIESQVYTSQFNAMHESLPLCLVDK